MYKIEYLPIAYKDIREAIGYVSEDLSSPKAARELYNEINVKVEGIRQYPYMYQIYYGEGKLLDEIRCVPIKNYLLFYIVKEDIIEIRRFIYQKRDILTARY